MLNRVLFVCILALGVFTTAKAHPGDAPETLDWVIRTATQIENSLSDAVLTTDWSNLLIKLMEAHDEFDAIALTGLYCHEARTAAETGSTFCNWLNKSDMDIDLNTCIVRATEARLQAIRMKNAAEACLHDARQNPPDTTFALADIIRSNAETIEHDLSDGLASEDFHIFSQKIEHAERVFHNTEILAATLIDCDEVYLAAREGLRACSAALLSDEWGAAVKHIQVASVQLDKMKAAAVSCK
jgi:hypothetical protein